MGPLFFSLVLHKAFATIDAGDDGLHFILQACYLDDEVLAGRKCCCSLQRFHDAFKVIVNAVHKNERKLDIDAQLSCKITFQVMCKVIK